MTETETYWINNGINYKGKDHIYLHILSYVYITYSVATKQIKQKNLDI